MIRKITSEGTTTYDWDYENRLVKVTTPTGAVAEFKYDPLGRRIEKKVTENGVTTTTRFFYDNEDILFEYDETGAIGNRYLNGPGIDEPLMLATGKDKYYYHADGLGSIVALTDGSGKIAQTYEYDSFGNLKDQKNRIKQPYTYTGREWDKETGLYYYRARYYNPMEGKFISEDPIGFLGGINFYSYVQNNPINFTDPTGLAPFDPKLFVQLTDSITGYSTKLSRLTDMADNYLINKALNTIGIPTSSLTGYLGTIGGGLLGAGGFLLSSPSDLHDPYLGADGKWYWPDGKPVKPNQCK